MFLTLKKATMKVLKICIMALSLGIFITSCNNKANCATSTADSSSASSVSAANPAVDTPGGENTNGSIPKKESESGAVVVHTKSATHRYGKSDTLASKGPDLKASKKREGNFTNGTGADNPGR